MSDKANIVIVGRKFQYTRPPASRPRKHSAQHLSLSQYWAYKTSENRSCRKAQSLSPSEDAFTFGALGCDIMYRITSSLTPSLSPSRLFILTCSILLGLACDVTAFTGTAGTTGSMSDSLVPWSILEGSGLILGSLV